MIEKIPYAGLTKLPKDQQAELCSIRARFQTSLEQARPWFDRMARIALERMVGHDIPPLAPANDLKAVQSVFSGSLPEHGTPLGELLTLLEQHFIPATRNKRSARYLAHIDVPPTDYSIVAGLLIRAIGDDPISHASSKAGTFLELAVIRWLAELTYGPETTSHGTLCSGGTQANLIALLLHRNREIQRHGIDVNEVGLADALHATAFSGMAVFASKAAHPSVQGAVRQIGIGDAGYCAIGVDESGRMSMHDLEARIADATRQRQLPIALVLTAGAPGSGAIDALEEGAEVARKYGIPVHVDAAHGGMLLFSDRWKRKVASIREADSVVLDPHKILGLNQGLGALAVRDPGLLEYLGKPNLPYFQEGLVRDLQLFTLDGSRPLNSLAAWMLLKAFGRHGYGQMVDHFMNMTATFLEALDTRYYEFPAAPEMNIVAYRLRPKSTNRTRENERNARILRSINDVGAFAISSYMREGRDLFLRTVFVNPATRESDVEALAVALNRRAKNEA